MRKKPAHSHGGAMKENRHSNNHSRPRNFTPRTNFDGEQGPRIQRPNTKNAGAAREKYLNMAREAMASGDRVLAENYLQHADHYTRVLAEEGGHIRPEGQQQRPRHDRQQRSDESAPGNMAQDAPPPSDAPPQQLQEGAVAPDSMYGTVRAPRQHHRRQRSHHHAQPHEAASTPVKETADAVAAPAVFPGLPGSIPPLSE